MATLYIRDVPDSVAAALKERAAAQGQSLSAYVGSELAMIASRPSNAEVVARLRERARKGGPTRDQVVEAVAASRR